jgi:predicted dehydrogenase
VPERLRVAVIGLGSMGGNHARVLAELPDAELAAVCDVDEARLRDAPASPGTARYRDYGELLAREAPDAAVVAVPTRLHQEVALACIERGVALLVEKPLGAGLEECLRLRDAAEAKGVSLMPGHVERFNPVVQAAKHWLDGGKLGRVYEVRSQRVGPFFERVRDVGVVHDLATHDIDLLHMLFACEVERVHAETQSGIRTPYEDALTAVLRLANGVVAVLEVNWLSPLKFRGFTMLSERGTLSGEFEPQALLFEAGAGKAVSVPVQRGEPLRAELAAFLRAARGEMPPPVTADDAIAAMRVVEAIIESARSGEAVRLAARGTAR